MESHIYPCGILALSSALKCMLHVWIHVVFDGCVIMNNECVRK